MTLLSWIQELFSEKPTTVNYGKVIQVDLEKAEKMALELFAWQLRISPKYCPKCGKKVTRFKIKVAYDTFTGKEYQNSVDIFCNNWDNVSTVYFKYSDNPLVSPASSTYEGAYARTHRVTAPESFIQDVLENRFES